MKSKLILLLIPLFLCTGCGKYVSHTELESAVSQNESLRNENAALKNSLNQKNIEIRGVEKKATTSSNSLQAKITALEIEIEALKNEIDSLNNGAPRLLAKAQQSYDAKLYTQTEELLNLLAEKHPHSPELNESAELKSKNSEKLKQERAKEEIEQALANLTRDRDDFQQITWFGHANDESLTTTHVRLYFGQRDDGTYTPLRLKIQYWGDDWIFADSVIFLALDTPWEHSFDFQRDHGSGLVWETADVPLTGALADTLVLISLLPENIKIRFKGRQHTHDFTLPQYQHDAIKDMMAAYLEVTGE